MPKISLLTSNEGAASVQTGRAGALAAVRFKNTTNTSGQEMKQCSFFFDDLIDNVTLWISIRKMTNAIVITTGLSQSRKRNQQNWS